MHYKGIHYTLRLGIARATWLVGIHLADEEVIEKRVQGSRSEAEHHPFSIIDALKKQQKPVLAKS